MSHSSNTPGEQKESSFIQNVVTAPTLTGNVDNYNPTGLFDSMVRVNADGNDYEISGFQAPPAGVNQIIYLNNTSSFDFRVMNDNSGSLAANRVLIRDGNNKDVKENETFSFWYDHISQRWRAYNRVG